MNKKKEQRDNSMKKRAKTTKIEKRLPQILGLGANRLTSGQRTVEELLATYSQPAFTRCQSGTVYVPSFPHIFYWLRQAANLSREKD